MSARVIDGKAIAKALRTVLKGDIAKLTAMHGRAPALGLIMVGNREDSALYVRNKNAACRHAGIRSENFFFDENVIQDTIVRKVEELNEDPTIDGILVQLPLPSTRLNTQHIINCIRHDKDVDGLHPFNAGELTMRGRYPYLIPCTARGILALLDDQRTPLRGKTAVIIGRSNLVGNPVSMLLQKRDATTILCHSKTIGLPRYVRQADVVVAACGQPYLVRGDWLKPGAMVIDVGINFVRDVSGAFHGVANADGLKLVGDVHFPEACNVAGMVTPVPGGVGPMTIAMLVHNVVEAFKRRMDTKK
ncbi:amino acid dehydrogenase family protein [Plasmopara halstedii]|uniref:Amino acid dehydrogenase family protein n=1 Tax=Plasmopara halstedii TaxID=4781 RepID=A0A0P1AGI8_PLAHL|nr:amino acid dehydrogenase family protein [Plasmopara halstedii]CEG39892.1 amino acid dehydrogenase family protein [Plasmopara halstedii]|eukprot:XP_024576261.1 amino acid dehydrogenase family protein [Plasmopara halstedii]